jgi:hypothetical protein
MSRFAVEWLVPAKPDRYGAVLRFSGSGELLRVLLASEVPRTQNQTIGQSRNRDAGRPCQYRNEEAPVHRQFSSGGNRSHTTDSRAELQVITHTASAI